VGYCTLGDEGLILQANLTAASLLGAARDDLEHQPITRFMAESDRDIFHHHRAALIESGEPLSCDLRMVKKDGSPFWAHLASTTTRGDDGAMLMRVALSDVSEQVQADERLARSNVLLNALINSPRDLLIFSLDPDYRYLAFNEGHREEMLRVWQAEIRVGANLLEYMGDPGLRELARQSIDRALGGEAFTEVQYQERLGIYYELLWNPFRLEDGTIGGVTVFIRDVTERKRVEVDMRTLSRAIEQCPASIVITDPTGAIEYVNPRFERVSGYSSSEVIGGNPRVLKSGHTAPETYARLWAAISVGGEWRGELCNRRKNGDLFWEFAAISGVTDEKGMIEHYIAVKEDITERKRTDEVRASLEAQLRQSQKMEALGTLAGGIAHDFNNIIATILGNTELARQDASRDSRVLESLHEIHKSGVRARELVQQILSFSRRQPMERKVISLAPVVEEAVHLLRSTLPSRVTIEVYCDAGVPPVLADATQIEQVVLNLANNAMQAMRGAAGRIDIRLDAVQPAAPPANATAMPQAKPPGRTVRLAVSDNGCGMDAATLERMFEPFFTTKKVNEGTGLGLAVVLGIVQSHEGTISAESQPGKGTTFTISLPACEADTVLQAPEAGVASDEAAPDTCGGRHVLYLDDDASLVFLATRMLERRGCRVTGCTTQREALDKLRADPASFDLLVTDYNMPGMSGLDVAREAHSIRADLPVAVASGFIDESLRSNAAKAGVRELIFKAHVVEDFCDAVKRLLLAPGGRP
jgi:PAS domain S-box-containing protein